MKTYESWSIYVSKIQEYLDSDRCLTTGLVVVAEGRRLRLIRDGMHVNSEIAMQALDDAIQYAEYSFYDPLDDDDDWEDQQFENPAGLLR